MALFRLGTLEVTPAARAALATAGIVPETLFARHGSGDWGGKDDWMHAENDAAARREVSSHAIRSRYRLSTDVEALVITAMDRSHTRLLLTHEHERKEVSVRDGYAAWASFYDAVGNPLVAVEEPVVEALLDTLPPFSTAVDAGTGTGRHALRLARRKGVTVTGYDVSPEMLAVARQSADTEKLSSVRFERVAGLGDTPLPAASGSFDLLVCALALCHVPNIAGAVAECARIVRPGGHLVLTDFHPAVVAFGWRTDFDTPGGTYLLPNLPHTRTDYIDALTRAECHVRKVQDIALGGEPYGDVSEAAIREKGMPPFCLVILAHRETAGR